MSDVSASSPVSPRGTTPPRRRCTRAFAIDAEAFAPADIEQRAGAATARRPHSARAEAFQPADPGRNPTAGWDPFAAADSDTPGGAASSIRSRRRMPRGYAEGRAAALAEAAAMRRAAIAALLDAISPPRCAPTAARSRADGARSCARRCCISSAKLVGEVGVAPDLLAARIEAATDLLADSAESALLRVHPDDVAAARGQAAQDGVRGRRRRRRARQLRARIAPRRSSRMARDLWLEQLAQAIDRVALPQS